MNTYWSYEKFLRKKESQIGSMLGATGALYAIRRNLFPQVPWNILVDDMYIPLSIIERGYRAIFEPEARAYDKPSIYGKEEFRRKVRTLAGNYQILEHFPHLLMPFESPIAWQFLSHKFLRLVVPFCLTALVVSNIFLLSQFFYLLFFAAQALFYGLALLEIWQSKLQKGKKGIGYIPYTFCLLNYSAVVALIQYLTGRQKVAWEKAYA